MFLSGMESLHVLLIDNHDSFVHNLYQYLAKNEGVTVHLVKNDDLPKVDPDNYDACVISPGPGLPQETAHLIPFIQTNYKRIPMLGICLGHQAIGIAFGGTLRQLDSVRHGFSVEVNHESKYTIFNNIPRTFTAGLYHSWFLNVEDLPNSLSCLAKDNTYNIMAIRHKNLPVYGFQFHPESYITDYGQVMIDNFVGIVRGL